MALDLKNFHEKDSPIEGLDIIRVEYKEDLKEWADVSIEAMGLPRDICYKYLLEYPIYKENSTMSLFLGYYNDEPVATALIAYNDGVAVIFHISSLIKVRKKGIGSKILRAALNEAKEKGYEIAIISASQTGYNMCQNMGFKTYTMLNVYVYLE